MRVTRAVAVAGLCCLMVVGCAASGPRRAQSYVVRPGDTLYGIAWRHDLDYRELAKWNNLGADYRLKVGQALVLSPTGAAAPTRAQTQISPRASVPAPPRARAPERVDESPHVAEPRASAAPRVGEPQPLSAAPPLPPPLLPAAPAGSPGAAGGAPLASNGSAAGADKGGGIDRSRWVWPTDRVTAPRPVPGGGILLLGRVGQDVRAAGTGRVVYTGSGIRGYGNLIIIKHGDTVLSSYAHNREVLVHEGQDVLAGQTIAHMGTGAHQVAALYFEIRLNGKPTDPMKYLAGEK